MGKKLHVFTLLISRRTLLTLQKILFKNWRIYWF